MAVTDTVLVDDFLAHFKPKRSVRTLYQYRCDLVILLSFIGNKALTQLTPADIHEFMYMPKANGEAVAPATAKRRLMLVRTFFRWAHETVEIIPKNQAKLIETPKVFNVNPHPITDDDWKKLWFSGLSLDMTVALALAYFFGLRREEITRLTASQFVDEPTSRINQVLRKGGKVQDVPLLSTAQLFRQKRKDLIGTELAVLTPIKTLVAQRQGCVALLPWEDNKNPNLGAWNRKRTQPDGVINPDMFNRKLDTLSRRLKLSEIITPHMLRHAFGTNLTNMGVHPTIIAKLMGHSSMTMTMRYVDATDDPLKKYLDESQHSDGEEHPRW